LQKVPRSQSSRRASNHDGFSRAAEIESNNPNLIDTSSSVIGIGSGMLNHNMVENYQRQPKVQYLPRVDDGNDVKDISDARDVKKVMALNAVQGTMDTTHPGPTKDLAV
jgi:hypothetical protein